ncbi:MAG: DUF134 domain-containing protein [Desulfobacteraceae bacterium]|nr:DUF134 domain-containing protein [Desulfobacteraceae bacterium]
MPRPKRPRNILSRPIANEFRPVGIDSKEEIILSLEEFEVIRLIDYEEMDQSQAAEVMNISRQTVGRVLKVGRYKLSKSIVEAFRLKVSGGCYKIHGNGYGPRSHGNRRGKGRKGSGYGMGSNKNRMD